MQAVLDVPPRFSFARTVLGHGWYDLPPFSTGDDHRRLGTVVELPSGGAVSLRMEPVAGGVRLIAPGRPGAADRRYLVAAGRH